MDMWALFGVLISGGLLTALGGFLGTVWQSKAEKGRAKKQRDHELIDRSFNLKREAYTESLKEFSAAMVLHIQHGGERQINESELLRINSAMTLFSMYAPDEIKVAAGLVLRSLQTNAPEGDSARRVFRETLTAEMRELTRSIKNDLGV